MSRGTDSPKRSNSEWLTELRSHGGSSGAAGQLRRYLRNGLASALRARRVGDADLDDFAQDALVRILQRLDTFRGDSRFTTWALAIATNTALSALRRRRYRERPLEELEAGSAIAAEPADRTEPDPARVVEREDLFGALERSIHLQLTARQRTAILGELAGVPNPVLAERLGINTNALYKLHHDARNKIRRALNDAGFSDEDVREQLASATNAL